jgi:hypothetical protein
VNDERGTAEGTGTDEDGDQHTGTHSTADGGSEFGITDDDMERIHSFLAKQRYHRSVDDLRPSSKR